MNTEGHIAINRSATSKISEFLLCLSSTILLEYIDKTFPPKRGAIFIWIEMAVMLIQTISAAAFKFHSGY